MKCSKCGYENDSQSNYCMNCGVSLFQEEMLNENNNNTFNSDDLNNKSNDIQNNNYLHKCPKCGYPNKISNKKCKNCEISLNSKDVILIKKNDSQINNDSVEVNKKKNIFIFSLFSAMYLLIPFFIILSVYFFDNNFESPFSIIILLISLLILVFGIEPLTCLTVKKIVKNTECMKKELMFLETILIVLISLIFLLTDLRTYFIVIILTLFRVLVWFITRKIFIKYKITINKKTIAVLVTYISLLFIIPNLILPTKLNKTLFNLFGSTDFSSKEFYTELIEDYNLYNDNHNRISYFHKLTDKELNEITEIYIEKRFNNKDIQKLNNLQELSISEKVKLDGNIDLTTNKKLTYVSISSPGFKNIKLPNSVTKFYCESILDELDISELKNIDELEIKTNKLRIKSLNQLKEITYVDDISFNTLFINDKKFGLKNGYISLESNYYRNAYIIYVPKYTKVADFTLYNLKIKVLRGTHNEEKMDEDELKNDDKIFIYDNDDNLLITLSANVRGDY